MLLEEAKDILKQFEINYSGSGSKIITQSPQSGERILEGSNIKLMLG